MKQSNKIKTCVLLVISILAGALVMALFRGKQIETFTAMLPYRFDASVVDNSNSPKNLLHFHEAFVEDGFGARAGENDKTFFHEIKAIRPGTNGLIYVLDASNYRIVLFSSEGEYISEFGGQGSGPGEFQSPEDMIPDENNNLYVLDRGNARIEKFNARGAFLTTEKADAGFRAIDCFANETLLLTGKRCGVSGAFAYLKSPENDDFRLIISESYGTDDEMKKSFSLNMRERFALGPDKRAIFFVRPFGYGIRKYDTAGNLLLEALSHQDKIAKPKVTSAVNGEFLSTLVGGEGVAGACVLNKAGNIFVNVYRKIAARHANAETASRQELDVYDADGKYLFTVDTPHKRLYAIDDYDQFYFVDASEHERIVRARLIKRTGSPVQ